MDTATTAKFGLLFLGLGFSATFLMYHLWGYPFDKEARKSAAPRWAMMTHRVIGYLFVGCYLLLMWQMLPRLWGYQVEFSPRTVVHIALGFSVGFLLLIKITILRFFRHFEEWMPVLGTVILFCTVLLLGFSIPSVFKERALADAASGGDLFSAASLKRVSRLLVRAELPKEAPLAKLATMSELEKGREVLRKECVRCHDLKTILIKPRTPSNWTRTVIRMGEKPTLFAPITQREQWQAIAYLVAITPDLQKSQKRLRQEADGKAKAVKAAATKPPAAGGAGMDGGVDGGVALAPKKPDAKKAKAAFEEECSQCHELSDVDDAPPKSKAEIDEVVNRMIENGFETEQSTIQLIKWYLDAHYVQKNL